MATAAAFEQQIKVATAGLSPQAISALMARTAKAALAEVIANGEASDSYIRSVNGRIGAPEESVIAPGPIIYRFTYLAEAALYALAFAAARSPAASGRYRGSWLALVDGMPWDGVKPIPLDAEVIVTNNRPYARKIEVGAMQMSVPPRIVESTRQAVMRRYNSPGNKILNVELEFINLAGAYILKGQRRLAKRNMKSSVFRAGRKYLSTRKDRAAGQPLTYPAVVITSV